MRLLLAVGDLLIAWRLIVAAEIALAALTSGVQEHDHAFYEGKVAVASFFATVALPNLAAELAVVSATDTTIMELDDAVL